MSAGLEIIRDIIKMVQHAVKDNSFSESHAEQIEKQLMSDYGGLEIYIPKSDSESRRSIILKEFNGRNRKELCEKHSISKTQFYCILKGD